MPRDQERRKKWIRLVRNDNIKADSDWTSVCSLHFPRGHTPTRAKPSDPSIFPWSAQWEGIVTEHNQQQHNWFLAQCGAAVDHVYSKSPRPLPVIKPDDTLDTSVPL